MAAPPALPGALRLLAPGATSAPDPAQRAQMGLYQRALESDPPGWWGANRYEQTNHLTGAVQIAVRAYMDAIGGAKITVQQKRPGAVAKAMGGGQGNYSRDDEYEPADPDHPLCRVVEAPGGADGVWSLGQECTFLTLQHMLTGEAPAWVPGNEAGKPVRFFALTSALVQPQWGAGANPQYPQGAYRVTPYGQSFFAGANTYTGALLPAEEVARFREVHPWARNMGYSRLQAQAKEVDVLEAITRSRWSYFDQGLQLDTAILMPGVDLTTAEDIQKTITQKQGGARNARRLMVLGGAAIEGSKFDIKQLGPPVREMDYNESYNNALRYVLGAFRVPGVVAGVVEGDNYAADWAAQRRFYDLGLHPYGRTLSVFLTQTLAKPWSTFPGEFKIEVEVPEPQNVEKWNEQLQADRDAGAITLNGYLRATNRPPVPDGDVPLSIYLAKLQQALQPQPVPGGLMGGAPGADGAPVPDQGQEPEHPPIEGEPDQPADDSPEGVQGAATAAALGALGVPDEAEQPAPEAAPGGALPVAKALAPSKPGTAHPKRNEGEKWQVNGQWYTKKNGKIEGIGDPSKQRPPAAPADSGGGTSHLDGLPAQPSGRSPKVAGSGRVPGAAPAANKRVTPNAGAPSASPAPAPAVDGFGRHDAMAKQLLAGRPSLNLLGPDLRPHKITDGASLKAFIAKGGKLPPQHMIEAAKSVPSTPAAKQTLSRVQQWAGEQAERHADRVAAHFGVSREKAKAILADAIKQIAKHAAANGGTASGTLRGPGGKTLAIGAKRPAGPAPAPQAAPRPDNPRTVGSKPPVAKAMSAYDGASGGVLVQAPGAPCRRKKKRKPVRDIVAGVLKALDAGE